MPLVLNVLTSARSRCGWPSSTADAVFSSRQRLERVQVAPIAMKASTLVIPLCSSAAMSGKSSIAIKRVSFM